MSILTENPTFILFQTLLSVSAPSGREDRLAALIRQKIESWNYQTETDAAGNLTVRLPGAASGPTVLLAAHMDEIGFTITHILADGSLRAIRSGGLFPWKAGEGPVEIITDREQLIPGVLSFGSTHTAQATNQMGISWKDARILTGLSPAELAEAGVQPGAAGTVARHVCQPVVLGAGPDPLVGAWTFDDRMGCVMLLQLLKTLMEERITPLYPTTIAFTTREEVGGYGARYLAGRMRPDIFMAIDGSPQTPDVDLALDGRPAAWAKDSLGPYDHHLLQSLREAAARVGSEIQVGAYSTNASDASLAQQTGAVGRTICFGHPRANSHGFEIVRASTFDHIHRILVAFLTTQVGVLKSIG